MIFLGRVRALHPIADECFPSKREVGLGARNDGRKARQQLVPGFCPWAKARASRALVQTAASDPHRRRVRLRAYQLRIQNLMMLCSVADPVERAAVEPQGRGVYRARIEHQRSSGEA